MDSSNAFKKRKKNYLCYTIIHEENKVNNLTFKFTYNELFRICKILDMDSNKLKYLVSTSKTTIFSVEIENQNLLKKIALKKAKYFNLPSFSFS